MSMENKRQQSSGVVSDVLSLIEQMVAELSLAQCDDIIQINQKIKQLSLMDAEGQQTRKHPDFLSLVVEVEGNIYERIGVMENTCRTLKLISDELHGLASALYIEKNSALNDNFGGIGVYSPDVLSARDRDIFYGGFFQYPDSGWRG